MLHCRFQCSRHQKYTFFHLEKINIKYHCYNSYNTTNQYIYIFVSLFCNMKIQLAQNNMQKI